MLHVIPLDTFLPCLSSFFRFSVAIQPDCYLFWFSFVFFSHLRLLLSALFPALASHIASEFIWPFQSTPTVRLWRASDWNYSVFTGIRGRSPLFIFSQRRLCRKAASWRRSNQAGVVCVLPPNAKDVRRERATVFVCVGGWASLCGSCAQEHFKATHVIQIGWDGDEKAANALLGVPLHSSDGEDAAACG